MHYSTVITLGLLAFGRLAAGHGAIIKAVGNAGGNGMAIGIDPSTPRDGTDDVPFQQDTTVFNGDAETVCGETDQTSENDETNDIETGVAAVMQETNEKLPQVTQGGSVNMTLHQVNGDGAGPYVCMISSDATGQGWVAMQVTTQVPGDDGNDDDGETTDFPLVAAVAADQTCTGTVAGQDGVCMVRCQNPQGPFGGCVAVQMVNAAKANAKVAAPKTSETGESAEDDIDAIVDAAEEAQDNNDDDGGLLSDLFNKRVKAKRAFRRKAKRAVLKAQMKAKLEARKRMLAEKKAKMAENL